jgi:asparagine synthase (glutamine-hydrolysing)
MSHALLITTDESAHERQPLQMGQGVHIVGDVRLDRRDDLAAALGGKAQGHAETDMDLLARAYLRWGEGCVDHISGDFAFAIWDETRHRLFCARDHFGVVPLYYCATPDGLVISTHLQCVLAHPATPATRDEAAMRDQLIVGMTLDVAATAYSAIRKLPPAHTCVWTENGLHLSQYWRHDTDVELLRYRRDQDYVDHFMELFEWSVSDRLRCDSAGSHLSGGLDSTSIAAIAQRQLSARGKGPLRTYTIAYDQWLQEDEGRLAAVVADRHAMPLETLQAEDYIFQAPLDRPKYDYPEPHIIANQVAEIDIAERVAASSRTLFAGFGGDPAFEAPRGLLPRFRSRGGLVTSAQAIAAFRTAMGTFPRSGLRSRMLRRQARDAARATLPEWIDPDFAARTDALAWYQDLCLQPPNIDRAGMADAALWSNIFAWSHPGYIGIPIKIRFPFFDLRLVEFLERTPALPWLHSKYLLRQAMQGTLPDDIRLRRKSPLPGSAIYNRYKSQGPLDWELRLAQSETLHGVVDGARLTAALKDKNTLTPGAYNGMRPALFYAHWSENGAGRALVQT